MGFGHRIQGLQPWAGSRIAVEESVCLSKTDPNTPCGEKMVIKMIHTRKPFEDMVNVMKACRQRPGRNRKLRQARTRGGRRVPCVGASDLHKAFDGKAGGGL